MNFNDNMIVIMRAWNTKRQQEGEFNFGEISIENKNGIRKFSKFTNCKAANNQKYYF